MSDEFISEIRMFAGSYVPRNWAQCDGGSVSVRQFTALYSLIGNVYGGNSQNFNLPNLQGRAPMCYGSNPYLSPRQLGESGGEATVSLQPSQAPGHNHNLVAGVRGAKPRNYPDNTTVLTAILPPSEENVYASGSHPLAQMNANALQPSGNGSAHNNMQPYLGILFGISLYGTFPPRP